jgi:hypothetical protein
MYDDLGHSPESATGACNYREHGPRRERIHRPIGRSIALPGPKGAYHLAGGWVDDGVPVYYDGWDRLVAVSHRSDEGSCVGVRPDVDLVD